VQSEESMSLFAMVMKGGWIMIPIFLLLGIAIFLTAETWANVNKLKKVNQRWFTDIIDSVYKGDYSRALDISRKSRSALGRMIDAGVRSYRLPMSAVEEDMQVEVRQIIAKPEAATGYLNMIATIAPMLGFLGTIFGVIKIFFNISLTNDLSIASISDGLYQKMICSGAGLLVGIVAYIAYYILDRRIDSIVRMLDKGANELVKAMTVSRGGIRDNV
jgi:biopolymer transport protein ExbB